MLFAYVLVRYGTKITISSWSDRTTSLKYPYAFFYLPAVLSGVLMAIYSVSNAVKDIIAFRNKRAEISDWGDMK